MNDLMDVREALGEPDPPSQAAYAAARAALMQRAAADRVPSLESGPPASRGRRTIVPRGRRTGWLAGGLGLTTAAAAAVAVLVAGGTAVGPATTTPISQLSGRQILLDAATTATAQPASTGKYWYLEERFGQGAPIQTWYTHDGTSYILLPGRKGVLGPSSRGRGFDVGGSFLTYEQITQLPTDPAALTAWILRSYSGVPVSPIPAEIMGLTGLILGRPAPPAVRAAAFRALAAMPDVTNLGQDGGDVVLRISNSVSSANASSGGFTMSIDSATFAVRSFTENGATTSILAARWTNTLPPVVSVPKFPKSTPTLTKPRPRG